MKKLFFAFATLLAGCQSERVAFQFQPVAPTATYVPRPAAPATNTEASAVAPDATAAASAAAPTASARPSSSVATRGLVRRALPVAAVAEPAAFAPAAPSVVARPGLPQRRLLRRLLRQHATDGQARTAESGLGGIGLFFIAIVLGLLAGLGALVSLIPGISFLGGVGLAAAGLLVIFLLYSLLSGGKKKPATK